MDRKVTSTKKDRKGNIVALCNDGQQWSPRRTRDVLDDIRAGRKSYYVQELANRVYVRALSGERLETTSDVNSRNNLGRLPNS
ncbi:MAG TPA: hypothetical protein VHE30_29075 [Polyangiaceae bacterium]|nr:hypothetical protein [Polyangiaceae bacterium]